MKRLSDQELQEVSYLINCSMRGMDVSPYHYEMLSIIEELMLARAVVKQVSKLQIEDRMAEVTMKPIHINLHIGGLLDALKRYDQLGTDDH